MEIMSTPVRKIFRLSLDGVFPIFAFSLKDLSLSTFCIDFREI